VIDPFRYPDPGGCPGREFLVQAQLEFQRGVEGTRWRPGAEPGLPIGWRMPSLPQASAALRWPGRRSPTVRGERTSSTERNSQHSQAGMQAGECRGTSGC
jgi:hypothetical protein